MIVKKNNKEIGNVDFKQLPALGSTIQVKNKRYKVLSYLVEKDTNIKIMEVA